VERAFQQTMERVRNHEDYGLTQQQPAFDPKQRDELVAMMSDGRKEEHFLQVLRYFRFVWRAADTLPLADGFRAQEGRWENKKLRMAFTPEDLTTGFPGGPAQFDEWIRNEIQRRRMARALAPKSEMRKLLGRR